MSVRLDISQGGVVKEGGLRRMEGNGAGSWGLDVVETGGPY